MSAFRSPVRCGAVAVVLGEEHDIGELPELAADPSLLALFRERGLRGYAAAKETGYEMARRCAIESLAKAGLRADEIGVVIYVTETLKHEPLATSHGLAWFLRDIGATSAYPIALSGSACANPAMVARIASDLAVGGARHVLVVIAEKVAGGASTGERIINEPGTAVAYLNEPTRITGDLGLTVCSDGAAAFVVSAEANLEWQMLSLGLASVPGVLRELLTDESLAFLEDTARGTREAVDAALGAVGRSRSDVARVLTNNCGMHIQRQMMRNAGFSMKQGFFDNIARFGHAFSVDNLANLEDSERVSPVAVGAEVVLLFCAMAAWGALLLQRR